jgi:cysteine desulfurase
VSRAYLDHASTSPLRPIALEAMLPYLREHHADPGRLHAEAHATRVAVEDAREQVAARFGARPREVVFTASGTEAVNTAIFGALARAANNGDGGGHVVTTAVEHSSVLDAVARGSGDVTIVGVDRQGRFDAQEVVDAVRPDTALVSIQLANHEVGTLQPAAEVVSLVRGRASGEAGAVVHVDACAAAGHVPVDFRELAADLCSVTGHTFGGPKGAAALLVRRGLRFPPFVVGGAQERARRAGIENVPAIVGFGAACAAIADDEAPRERALTERLAAGALRRVDGVERYGDPDACLPHLVCLGVEGVEAEPILLALDQRGVAVHSGSSCSSESLEPSPVLAAMGVDADRSLRASVGWSSTDDDVDAFLDAFPVVVGLLRDLRR